MNNYIIAAISGLYIFIGAVSVLNGYMHATTVNTIQNTTTALTEKIEQLEFDVWIEEPKPQITKQRDMRVTGYVPTGNKTALGENVVVGRTAAVSRNCMDLLGEKVYIEGHGIRYVNDLTAQWVGEKFDICTIDLAVPTEKHAMQIGNEVREVIHIPINESY